MNKLLPLKVELDFICTRVMARSPENICQNYLCLMYILVGANDWGTGKYMADITSYDYDAVMDESGDPNNPKFEYVKDVIEKHFELSPKPLPERAPKMTLSPIQMVGIDTLLSARGRKFLGRPHGNSSSNPSLDFEKPEAFPESLRESIDGISITHKNPISFEALNQYSGLILYEVDLPPVRIDPTLLKINGLRDRAIILLDGYWVGTLSRENAINSMPLSVGNAKRLQILVENQGRINFNVANDTKGILGTVTLQQFDGSDEELNNWRVTGYPLTNYGHLKEFIASTDALDTSVVSKSGRLLNGPVVFHAEFRISDDQIYDTYLNPSGGWGKVIFLNAY